MYFNTNTTLEYIAVTILRIVKSAVQYPAYMTKGEFLCLYNIETENFQILISNYTSCYLIFLYILV